MSQAGAPLVVFRPWGPDSSPSDLGPEADAGSSGWLVGPAGGLVSVQELELSIPAGALAAEVEITVLRQEMTTVGDIVALSGDLFGDPDFCVLQIRAGTNEGLPSPGSSTLTRIGGIGGEFQVDSFFDIEYTIAFVGCPGSALEGFDGITHETDRFEVCPGAVPVEGTTWGKIKLLLGCN